MRRTMLLVIALGAVALACTPVGAEPRGVREAYVPISAAGTARIDSARYPAGATIEVLVDVPSTPDTADWCAYPGLWSRVSRGEPLPGSVGCELWGGPRSGVVVKVSTPVPLPDGDLLYFANLSCPTGRCGWGFNGVTGTVRIRW